MTRLREWYRRERLLYPVFGLWGCDGRINRLLPAFGWDEGHFWCCGRGSNFIYKWFRGGWRKL
jgi:hypothetical protein